MEGILTSDYRLAYPEFYNIYPIINEVSIYSGGSDNSKFSEKGLLLDDNYGRVLNSAVACPYGNSKHLPFYKVISKYQVAEELRVPFRKIPVFKFESVDALQLLINEIKQENATYEVLLRGQTKMYTINRSIEEKLFLFGEDALKEPSFHPSFLRSNFNEYFIYALWHSQTAMLLNDVGIDLKPSLTPEEYRSYCSDIYKIKNSPHFTTISLGFAQHYGLPSVGLDLTNDLKVAAWFASYNLLIDDEGIATPNVITDFSQSTIFIFRCPADTVFSYRDIKPKYLHNTRPDRQNAWFGHCGWGMSKNQLASYLTCAIRLNSNILNGFDEGYARFLFPQNSEDHVLDYFLNMKENTRNIGDVARALKKIYTIC